jgi:two-component system chemotaxis sensor kinase CheA
MKSQLTIVSGVTNSDAQKGKNVKFIYSAIGLVFVITVCGTLAYTSKISSETARGYETVRIVAGMDTTVQETAKTLQVIEKKLAKNESTTATRTALKEGIEDFTLHLNALEKGEDIQDSLGKSNEYQPRENEVELGIILKIKKIWEPLAKQLLPLTSGESSAEAVVSALQETNEKSSELATLIGSLFDQVQKTDSSSMAGYSTMRNILIVLASIALIAIPAYFLYLLGRRETLRAEHALTELNTTANRLAVMERAKSETDRIMETVQEGLFLIDEKGIIGEHYSNELPRIFRQQELAGLNLYGILQRYLSQKMYTASRDFFTMLFDSNRKEKTILKVNPLTDVEINFPDPNGGFNNRYLGFSFRRVMDGDKVDRVFVAVRDVTNQILLEKRLRESEKNKERELEILLSIIHIPTEELSGFITLAQEELDSVNNTMRAEDFANSGGKQEALRIQLESVFRSIHNINGNAALLRLGYFQNAAHLFEEQIKTLQERTSLNGDDFVALVVAQAGMRDDLANLVELSNKLKQIGANVLKSTQAKPVVDSQASQLAEQLRQLVHNTARDQDKVADLEVDEYALHSYSIGRNELVRDVLVQLARNSIAHGVETPEVRTQNGKDGNALLSIRALPSPAPGVVGLAFRDDGKGLDSKRISEKAKSLGLIKEGAKLSDQELVKLIFEPAFSTTEQADLHSGRGVGMSIVKDRLVNTAGGCIEVVSEPGQFCEFRLYLPA